MVSRVSRGNWPIPGGNGGSEGRTSLADRIVSETARRSRRVLKPRRRGDAATEGRLDEADCGSGLCGRNGRDACGGSKNRSQLNDYQGDTMALFDFVRDAGEKLFGRNKEEEQKISDTEKSTALQMYLIKLGLPVKDLVVAYRGNGLVEVYGLAASQADKEKAILAVGNAAGIERVDDRIRVETPAPAATFYTVKSGDTLSKIAKTHYGEAGKYPAIFEANKPMLTDPDKIYPGQVLRIPPQ
jgi:hypothetical protein